MRRLSHWLDVVAGAVTMLAGFVGLLMMLHVTADVIGRTLFHHPLSDTLEIVSAYYMVAIAFLPLAWIARQRGHIIVELFTGWMSKRRVGALDAIVGLVTFFYIAFFTYEVTLVAIDRTHIGETWESATGFVAVWPSRWLVPAGFGLMAFYVLFNAWRDFRRARGEEVEEPEDKLLGLSDIEEFEA